MTTNELIAVLRAYDEGKRIQCKDKRIKDDEWVDILSVGEKSAGGGTCVGQEWNTVYFDYRVKPEPHYRPFKSVTEVMEAIKEHGDWVVALANNKWRHRIISYSEQRVITGYNYEDCTDGEPLSKAFEKYTFLDGTPFGKMEE